MQNVNYAECHQIAHNDEWLYAECHYAECRHAEFHYAKCRYAEFLACKYWTMVKVGNNNKISSLLYYDITAII
jgi:hypothetical protein